MFHILSSNNLNLQMTYFTPAIKKNKLDSKTRLDFTGMLGESRQRYSNLIILIYDLIRLAQTDFSEQVKSRTDNSILACGS